MAAAEKAKAYGKIEVKNKTAKAPKTPKTGSTIAEACP